MYNRGFARYESTHRHFQEFNGRARFGKSFIASTNLCPSSHKITHNCIQNPTTGRWFYPVVVDDNGHGTHCAGTIAGEWVGVAKEAEVVAVKVLSGEGSGSTSGIMQALDWGE
jgi:subtilisin family serine protease